MNELSDPKRPTPPSGDVDDARWVERPWPGGTTSHECHRHGHHLVISGPVYGEWCVSIDPLTDPAWFLAGTSLSEAKTAALAALLQYETSSSPPATVRRTTAAGPTPAVRAALARALSVASGSSGWTAFVGSTRRARTAVLLAEMAVDGRVGERAARRIAGELAEVIAAFIGSTPGGATPGRSS